MRSLLWRAPLAALASPLTVLVAVVTGMVVAFVAAGTVFHVSASGSAATQFVVATRCADDTGMVMAPAFDHARGALLGDPAALPAIEAAAARRGLPRWQRTRSFPVVLLTGGAQVDALLIERTGGIAHLTPVDGGGSAGAWVPAALADQYGLRPGSTLAVDIGAARHELPVAAVYPTFTDPLDEFWCSERRQLVPNPLAEQQLAAVVLPSPVMDVLLSGVEGAEGLGSFRITGPPPGSRTAAAEQAAAVDALRRDVAAISGPQAFKLEDKAAFLATVGPRAQRAVTESLLPLSAVSLLIGLGAVVGLARQWAQRRLVEVRLLWSRGVPPSVLATKAALELTVPLAAGAALGWSAARFVVPAVGPASRLDPWASGLAAVAAAATWLAAVLVLAAAAGMLVRRQFQPRTARRRLARVLRRVPWEVAALGGAVLCYLRLRRGAVTVDAGSLLPVVDAVALLFPLACLAVVVGVALRLAGLALRLGHRLRGWRRPALLWAVRRAAAQHRLVLSLVAVAGLAVGVVAVGVGVSSTEKAAVADKGRVYIGTDTVVRIGSADSAPDAGALPPAVRDTSSVVWMGEVGVSGTRRGRLLVIDPATFARAVVWRDQWTGHGLTGLLVELGPAGADGRLPVIQVGGDGPSGFADGRLPPMNVVATLPAFLGMGDSDGMLVLSTAALDRIGSNGLGRYVWARGEPAAVVSALAGAGYSTGAVLTAVRATDGLPFLVVAWTFDFFVLIGAVLAAVAAAALLVAIEARSRATAVAHALLARMGLRTRSLWASSLAELAAIAAAAMVVGLGGGWLVLAVAGDRLDPAVRLSPAPVPASLLPLAAAVVVAAAVAVVAVAALAVRAALRAPVRELLRG